MVESEVSLQEAIDEYLESNWDAMVADIDRLVRVPSVEDLENAVEGAPFGPEPARALNEALALASEMGFETKNIDGYAGIADFPGETDVQLGIIGHVDVVPAGPGWTFEPYQVTRKDGYLLGRGVVDDKGPSVMALHAMKFWHDRGQVFPCTVRFIFGANEETGMGDVSYYRAHYADPAFLFTPDAEFPVCYGEKGRLDVQVESPALGDGVIVEFQGGAATNAVPGTAFAVVRVAAGALPDGGEKITVKALSADEARIDAVGKSVHASTPEGGDSALATLVDYLLKANVCAGEELAFLRFEQQLLAHTDGSGVGIACEDEHFGALTCVGGTAKLENGRILQTIDMRFPAVTSQEKLVEQLGACAAVAGAQVSVRSHMAPFLMDPDSPAIQALLTAYNEATGESAQPFTMGGGTYAREFTCGASFGPGKPWEGNPAWVGTMHGPDEGVSEELLKQAFRVYVLTLLKLSRIDLTAL